MERYADPGRGNPGIRAARRVHSDPPGEAGRGSRCFGEQAAEKAADADPQGHSGREDVAGGRAVADQPLGGDRSEVGAGQAAEHALPHVDERPQEGRIGTAAR